MSLTGNPPHLGHMAAIAAAIDGLARQNIRVNRVLVSLSAQTYLEGKITPGKFALKNLARIHLLDKTIQEAARRGMFRGVAVEFWNDQKGYEHQRPYGCDHPESYSRLSNPQLLQGEINAHRITPLPSGQHDVYLVAGSDLCRRMSNWPSIKNAIIVKRNEEDSVAYPPNPQESTRLFLDALYPEFESFSSSAVQRGEQKLEPQELQDYFDVCAQEAKI